MIAKRHQVVSRYSHVWGLLGEKAEGREPHRLSKWNLTCGCGMCNKKRYRRNTISVSNGKMLLPFEPEDVEQIPANLLRHLQLPHRVYNV